MSLCHYLQTKSNFLFLQNSLQVSWDSALTLSFLLVLSPISLRYPIHSTTLLLLPQFVSIFSLYLQQGSDRLPAPSHCHSDETVSTMSFMWMNPLGWNSQTIKPRKSTTNLTVRHVHAIFLSAFMCVHCESWNQSCVQACSSRVPVLDVASCLCRIICMLRR